MHILLFIHFLRGDLILEYLAHYFLACLRLVEVNNSEGSPAKLLLLIVVLLINIDLDFLFLGNCLLFFCNSGGSPGCQTEGLIKFYGGSHLLHLESRDQPGDFTPVIVIGTNQALNELRGVDDPAAPAVELRVPLVEV